MIIFTQLSFTFMQLMNMLALLKEVSEPLKTGHDVYAMLLHIAGIPN